MHLAPLIRDLSVLLGVGAAVAFLFHRIRQPLVLGYILAGFLLGPYSPLPGSLGGLRDRWDLPNIRAWAELGVIFLMFSLGLDFSFRRLAKVGRVAGGTALFEVFVTMAGGAALGRLLGWSLWESVFLGALLSIGSTTLIVRILDELRLRTRRFAEMILAVLIVEDLIAILLLTALPMLAGGGGFSGLELLLSASKLVLVVGGWFVFGYFIVPRFVRTVGRTGNEEMLTLLSLGLCLLLAVFAARFGYSVALGAFIMGSILAETAESRRIGELITPLKDLFAAVFFISIGMLIRPEVIAGQLGSILLVAGAYIVIKAGATTIGALIAGQTIRMSVQVGLGLAQIGEFSFIIAGLGFALGIASEKLFSMAVGVSTVTTFLGPYLMRSSHRFAVALERRLAPGFREFLDRYAAWTQERLANRAKGAHLRRFYFRWAINGLVVTVIFLGIGELGWQAQEDPGGRFLAWTISLLLSAPFIWAMLSSFRGEVPFGALFLGRLLTVAWVGTLSLEFLKLRVVALATAAAAGVLFLVFYRKLEASYHWFEKRFLSAFEAKASLPSVHPRELLKHLAPWDAHLVRVKVHPNAQAAGKRICECAFRSSYGVNIVGIQRGLRTLVAPGPCEMILPDDELLVLGTDEAIERFRREIESLPGLERNPEDISGYELRQVWVSESSSFVDHSIRQCGIRERFGAMVVGVERNERRMVNPESDFVLKAGDALWIVGKTDDIARLAQEAGRG